LFDTFELEDVLLTLSGETSGVANLRVPGKKLREDFILREKDSIGVAFHMYSITAGPSQTTFQFPETIPYVMESGETVGFPALPVMKNATITADPSDVSVKINGVSYPGAVSTLNAITGELTLISAPPAGATVEFTYLIQNERTISITNTEASRILDYIYVFGGACPDPIQITTGTILKEYVNFLSDYSHGIKVSYFNKGTKQIEEHVFSGPVFELYDVSEDQIGAPGSFQNALIKIKNPIHSENPLTHSESYDFMDDNVVRFRKKTFKELLPDRTFRDITLMEMMAV